MRWRRLLGLPRRTDGEIRRDVDEELAFHLAAREDALRAQGLAPSDAHTQALREFGDLEDARQYMAAVDRRTDAAERRRDYLGNLRQDVGYAFRKLRSAPGFAFTAIVTLALGVGANTAIFSVVNGVLLRPLPFPEPEQLYRVWHVNRSTNLFEAPVSAMDLDDWRAQRRQIADLGGYFYQADATGLDLTSAGEPLRLSAVFVTAGFFATLGGTPAVGRLPREDEMVRGGPDQVVVLSEGFWRRHFGGAPSVVGTSLTLGGRSYEVLGVLPERFAFPAPNVDVYVPYSTIPDEAIPRLRFVRVLGVVARAKPGVALEAVAAEMNGIAQRMAKQYQEDQAWDRATVRPLHDAITGTVRRGLLVLLGAVGFVLLIVCVNVASLQLARASAQEREVAVRAALGATRGRLVRQLLTESVVLALLGGAAGLALARLGIRAIVALGAGQIPRGADVRIDGVVLAFALATSILTGILFGLVPALRLSGRDLQQRLRLGGRGVVGGNHAAVRHGLVIAEVSLAMILVIGGGLMVRSFVALTNVDPGFRSDHLLAFNMTLSTQRHGGRYREVYAQILERVRAIPGVRAAGAAKDAPFRGPGEQLGFMLPGVAVPQGEDAPMAAMLNVSDGYFHAIGARMLAGREFTPADRANAPFVIVVNQAFARHWFRDENAVGKRLILGDQTTAEVVGVVNDIRQTEVAEAAVPTVYVHEQQNARVRMHLLVRTQGPPGRWIDAVREAIRSVDRLQPITAVYAMDDAVGDALARPRLLAVLLGAFGVIGLLLGALGLYGVLAYLVSQRRRELGVRLALGAQRRDVLVMVVRWGMTLTAAGVAIGTVGALAVGGALRGVLFGVSPTDPLTFVLVAVTLFVVASLASLLPARRAAAVDVVQTLRDD